MPSALSLSSRDHNAPMNSKNLKVKVEIEYQPLTCRHIVYHINGECQLDMSFLNLNSRFQVDSSDSNGQIAGEMELFIWLAI